MTLEKIDRFVIDGVAGKGGMGTVYRAHDERTGERVAVKVITNATPQAMARFSREIGALMRVNNVGVVRYIAHGTTDANEPYLAMDWIDGKDLATLLEAGPLSLSTALELARGLANALAALHAQGLVHRDLKPQNILLADGDPGRPVIVDLGIARQLGGTAMTATGAIVGTAQYMAPEQIESRLDIDPRADLFALGCVLFECIAGRAAFIGDNALAVLANILVAQPPALAELGIAVPTVLEDLLASLLQKRPSDRPATALDVAARLATCAQVMPSSGDPSAQGAWPRVVTVREHRAITVVMATGITGGTGLLATLPADAPSPASRVEQIVGRHGGRSWVLRSDRVLLTFAGAREAADEAAQAVRCAFELLAAHPTAIVALAVGSAQVEGVPVGDVINRVATLLERARPGYVRVDTQSVNLIDVRFHVDPREDDFEIGAELETIEPPRTLLGRRTRCVGRERELATLIAAHDEVVDESVARAVIVTAPSGIGKSRLRHELMQRLQRQESPAGVLVARAEALRADSPLDLLAGLLRAGVGIEPSSTPAEVRAKLTAAVQRGIPSEPEAAEVAAFLGEILGAGFPSDASPRLAAARADTRLMGAQMTRAFVAWVDAESRVRPLVLVLEDLHWGDHQTVRFLDAALRDLSERPLLVLALARPEVHDRFPGLWKARGVVSMSLSALSKRACEQLVRDVVHDLGADVIEQIVQRSDGNAFYLEELVRAAAQRDLSSVPASVIAMVQVRLEAFDGAARRMLRAASVFGERFVPEGAAALIGGTSVPRDLEAALDELVEREVIRREQGEYAFRHALVREAAYAMLTPADRSAAHRLAAEWLEAHGESDALLLAQHFDRAQDAVNATRCFARAARQALDKNDFEAALERAKRSLDLGAVGGVLAEARAMRGKACAALGRWAEAESELDAALTALSDDAYEARLEVSREMYFVATFRQSSAFLRKAGNEVMALAERFRRPELVVEASSALAIADHTDGRCDAAVERFLDAAARRGERPSSVVGMSAIVLYHAGLHDQAISVCQHLARIARDNGDLGTAVILYANLGLSLAGLGRYEEARDAYAESRGLARANGLATLEARTVSLTGGHYGDVLDLDGAERVAREACALGQALEFSTPRISSSIDLVFVAIRRGALDEADAILTAITHDVQKGTGFHGWLWRERVGVARGQLDLARGDFASALRRADASIVECRQHRRLKYEASAQIVRAHSLVGLGSPDDGVSGLSGFLRGLTSVVEPSIRWRVSTALLEHTRDEYARSIADDAASCIEAGLPAPERPPFRARVDEVFARIPR